MIIMFIGIVFLIILLVIVSKAFGAFCEFISSKGKDWKALITVGWTSVVIAGFIYWFFMQWEPEKVAPASAIYHTAEDLYRVTGVKFPEVVPVDSFGCYALSSTEERVTFVAKKPLSKKFYRVLDHAVEKDSKFWSKDSKGYTYVIYPEDVNVPIDRTKGIRTKEPGFNESTYYVSVFVPIGSDTISVVRFMGE